jgi:Na+/proline symporter
MDYPGKNKAIASLVLGIISLAFISVDWIPFVNILPLAVGIVGIILAINAKKEMAAAENAPTGMVTAALVLSVIGTVFAAIFFISCTMCVACIGTTAGGLDEINRELQDQLQNLQ